ncbi:BTB/POZ domain-containing protein [Histoplasma capsulatum]|uniref:BTB/POZ domain-containing protein n=1 Tax=Ajellomyces capsulatus TaxID=5037 RepID=A0A8A1M9J6_AJECA|nr:BTB/POZ domain-containing protein [Histoplasma capsulatum]
MSHDTVKTSIDKYHPVSDLGGNPRGAVEDSPALFHAQMYAIGEKFGISGLKSLAKEKLEGDIDHIWCGRTVVQVIYGTTYPSDRGLRDVIVRFADQNITALKIRPEFEETLEDFPSSLGIYCGG